VTLFCFWFLTINGLIQKAIPESGSGQTPANGKPKNERADDQHNNMNAPGGNEAGKTKSLLVAGLIFAGFEALGYICSDIAEGLGSGYMALFVHWIALCCSAASFLPLGMKWSRVKTQNESGHFSLSHAFYLGLFHILSGNLPNSLQNHYQNY
jgi:hypothetical protein